MMYKFAAAVFCLLMATAVTAQRKKPFAVIAYYAGNDVDAIRKIEAKQLTHIIFSFCHLKGAALGVDSAKDSAALKELVKLKKKSLGLKVMVSLGGWGGCSTCSEVFSSEENRVIFANSVKEMNKYFGTDGIDLDWEYPAIEGYPGHLYQAADKANFTLLVQQLRKTLGPEQIISFAAGGFPKFIDQSVNWPAVMKAVNFVNLMTYDLVDGYATATGHHTPLYSTPQQPLSVNAAVEQLLALNVPNEKIVIGAAFYGRMWEAVPNFNNGLHQPGRFKESIAYKNFQTQLAKSNGFVYYWDSTAKAPYLYNAQQQLFVTFDDARSLALKTQYAIAHKLGGIMFWELSSDAPDHVLLHAINEAKKEH